MMWKIQSKIKDSNLRDIDHQKKIKTHKGLQFGDDDEESEEEKFMDSPF